MRCVLIVALCFALASADWRGLYFKNLLNKPYYLKGLDGIDIDDHINYYLNDLVDLDDVNFLRYGKQCPVLNSLFDIEDELVGDKFSYIKDFLVGDKYSKDFLVGDKLSYIKDLLLGDKIVGDKYSYINDFLIDDLDLIKGVNVFDKFGLLKEIEDANVKLASRLYKHTKDDKDDKNIVFSPLSIQLALSALNLGAKGNTKLQINRVIGGHLKSLDNVKIFKNLLLNLKGINKFDLVNNLGVSSFINPVTVLAINKNIPVQQLFVQFVTGKLDVHVKHFNFQHQPQVSAKLINNVVAKKTNFKLNHIVPLDAITDNTKMVLVNGLELKATWGKQLLNHVTKIGKFFPLETKKVKLVEFLQTVGVFKYYENELVKIVGIPTLEKELTFYLIVPKFKDALVEVEKLYLQDGIKLKDILDKTDLHLHKVGVQLPKFQIKHKIDVRRTLLQQGVVDAFDPLRADFSGITGIRKDVVDIEDDVLGYKKVLGGFDLYDDNVFGLKDKKLHLNKFIHQTTIKVTGKGITAVNDFNNVINDDIDFVKDKVDFDIYNKFDNIHDLDIDIDDFGGDLLGKKVVKANHAFAFAIKHNPTNQLVVVGRVIDAAQKKVINNVYDTLNVVDQL